MIRVFRVTIAALALLGPPRVSTQVWADAAPDYRPRGRAVRHADLIRATVEGELDEVRTLLKRGADPAWEVPRGEFIDHGPAVVTAARHGHVEILKLFLDQRPALLTSHSRQVMMVAVSDAPTDDRAKFERHVAILKLLLERQGKEGPGPATGEPMPQQILSEAIRNRSVELVRFALDKGALVNQVGGTETPLGEAIRGGHLPSVQELIKRGADLKQTAKVRPQLLLDAIAGRNEDIAALIIDRKIVDINYIDTSGSTALIHAAGRGDTQTVRRLLAAGASPKIKNQAGETALSQLKSSSYLSPGQKAIIKLLQDALDKEKGAAP